MPQRRRRIAAATRFPRRHRVRGSPRRVHFAQRVTQTGCHEVVHQTRIEETHLQLGGMHVDIDIAGVQLQKNNIRCVTTRRELVTVGLADGMTDDAVTNAAPVDEEELSVRLTARKVGRGNPAEDAHPMSFEFEPSSVP